MINKIEDYLNKGSYPYFSACEKIYTIHRKEEFIVGKDKYFSIMDTYIAKYITDKEYNKDEVIINLINVILSQLELKAYANLGLPNKCFIRDDFEDWVYKVNSEVSSVDAVCIAVKCRVGFLNTIELEKRKNYVFYESDLHIRELIE